jgi:hypothetical protein
LKSSLRMTAMEEEREEMLRLLKEYYPEGKQQSAIPDTWKLASTISENPVEWWPGEVCPCGQRASSFQQGVGYRCPYHRHATAESIPPGRRNPADDVNPLYFYAKGIDRSGDYEHEWVA